MAVFTGQSFDGVSFSVEQAGGSVPHSVAESQYVVRHVPYSDRVILDLGGKAARRLDMKVWVDAENRAAFEAKLQESGDLVYLGVTYSATLVGLTGGTMLRDALSFSYQATFILG